MGYLIILAYWLLLTSIIGTSGCLFYWLFIGKDTKKKHGERYKVIASCEECKKGMKITTQYRVLEPDTFGYKIQVISTYSSFDKSEIDAIEEDLNKKYGYCSVQEFEYQKPKQKPKNQN